MGKLAFASTVTIGLLVGMVAGVVLAAMVAAGQVDFTLAVLITIVLNALIWFVSPWITDLTLRWFNKLSFLDDAELRQRHPGVHQLIHAVADKHGFTAPSVGIIPDRNPTAFTYGRLRNNARIVVTQGIFEFLNEDEAKAVVAHELGHIVHRDFIVMTVAGTLVQILYQLYAVLVRAGRSDKKGAPMLAIAITALVFYYLGLYIVLYLSRTREYYADAFSAEHIEARHLANALIKIAYGIVKVEDTQATQTLLQSTRHMGVVDVKNARQLGLFTEGQLAEPERAAEAMLFDNYNPWAHIIELNSTHPLTGRRIAHLEAIAQEKRQPFAGYDMKAAAQRVRLDTAYLWRKFWREISLYFVPVAAFVAAILIGAWKFAPAAAALGVLATLRVRFPSGDFPASSVVKLMTDPAASPVVGRPARLDGKAIGRVNPGFFAGEDVIYQDSSGLLPVDFRSMLGFIGDLFAGWKRVPKHIGEPGNVSGWFRRSMGGYIILSELNSTKGQLRARPYFWQMLLSIVVILANLYVVFALPASTTAQLFEPPATGADQRPAQ
jgi:Zn-dependent protease with chaperone function